MADTTQARELLDRFALVDSVNELGETALHIAAVYKREKLARLLLGRGASVDASSTLSGMRPLHYAAVAGSLSFVGLLLQERANALATNFHGQTAAYLAENKRHGKCAAVLLQAMKERAGAGTFPEPALLIAAAKADTKRVKHLLQQRADPNSCDAQMSALQHACARHDIQSRHVEVARLLLEANALLSLCKRPDGMSALHLAAAAGCDETVKLLLERGADQAAHAVHLARRAPSPRCSADSVHRVCHRSRLPVP